MSAPNGGRLPLPQVLERLSEHIRSMSKGQRLRYLRSFGYSEAWVQDHLDRWETEYGSPRRFGVIQGTGEET
jgi:hypothetical protein